MALSLQSTRVIARTLLSFYGTRLGKHFGARNGARKGARIGARIGAEFGARNGACNGTRVGIHFSAGNGNVVAHTLRTQRRTRWRTHWRTLTRTRVPRGPFITHSLFPRSAFPRGTMAENRKKHRQNSHLIIHCPTSEGVSEVSKRANE